RASRAPPRTPPPGAAAPASMRLPRKATAELPAHGLRLQKRLEAFHPVQPAEPAVPESAGLHFGKQPHMAVDPHAARADGRRDALGAHMVARPDARRETEAAGVRLRGPLGLAAERLHRQHRTEDLLAKQR